MCIRDSARREQVSQDVVLHTTRGSAAADADTQRADDVYCRPQTAAGLHEETEEGCGK